MTLGGVCHVESKLSGTRGFYAQTGTALNKDCIKLIKRTMQGDSVLAYVYKGSRTGLIIKTVYFSKFTLMKPLIIFIDEYCEIKVDKSINNVYSMWEFLEKSYGVLNHHIDLVLQRRVTARMTPKSKQSEFDLK